MNKIDLTPQLDYNNVLIKPKPSLLSSRSEVNIERTFVFNVNKDNAKEKSVFWTGVPLISANMDTTGTFEIYNVLSKYNIITALHKFYDVKDYIKYSNNMNPDLFMVSCGINDFEKLCDILTHIECNWICIDIANGYIKSLVDYCKKVRAKFPLKKIVAGNVASKEKVEELIIQGGVDVVKIGIGPGSACTTRIKTGVGVPQLSAVIECANAAHRVGGKIIADGGITCPGDVSKAFGGGADFVMIGGQFAGCDEGPGEIVKKDGKNFKKFHGMSSKKAMEIHYGSMDNYRTSEGREILVPYRGNLDEIVQDYLGGIRSTCTYIGANKLEDMEKCTTFGLANQQFNTCLLNNISN
jgi:GMP reductase|tara:strand:- start:675 stop:1736 length:1062 start_codon:yes stop_codon:yes gene_type:complete